MRHRIISALASLALIMGLGAAPAVASPVAGSAVAFDAANPPPRYSPAIEKARTLKGIKGLPKGKIVNGKGWNPNAKLLTGPYYFYAGAWQILGAGESATTYDVNLNIEAPYLDTTNDAHTLAEQAIQSSDTQQTVELGSTHDPSVCGAGNSPCLFAGSWKNGVFLGYNTGFVDYAPNATDLGDTLTTGTVKRFYSTYSGGVWWMSYESQWVGYFPGSIWTNAPNSVTFDKGGVFNGFYEVATKSTGDTTPCTDMGNGKLASDTTSARSYSNAISGTLPGAIANNFVGYDTDGTGYTHVQTTARTTRTGGPGYNAAGTGVGTTGSC